MVLESIILCGGEAKRLKPYFPFNKALADIGEGKCILQYQVEWLKKRDVERVILAIDENTYDQLIEIGSWILNEVECSIEREKLGTGGAIKKALDFVESNAFYLMNVDDILLSESYHPIQLFDQINLKEDTAGVILLSTTEFPFGVVETHSDLVKGFIQKPILDFKVNAGHYAFTKNAIEVYFPEKGNFEDLTLPKMAQDRRLYSHEFLGEWVTINNIKQLERAKHRLHSLLH